MGPFGEMTQEKQIEEMEKLLTAQKSLDDISTDNELMHFGKYRAAVDALNDLIEDYDNACPPPYFHVE